MVPEDTVAFLITLPKEKRMELQMHLEAMEGIAYPEDAPHLNRVRILCDPDIAEWVHEWLEASREELEISEITREDSSNTLDNHRDPLPSPDAQGD